MKLFKNLTISILSLLILCTSFNINAKEKPYFIIGPPTVLVKSGIGTNQVKDDKNSALMIEFESGVCYEYVNCFNPYIIGWKNNGENDYGVGVDYVYQVAKTKNKNALKVSIGPVAFDKREPALHVGATFEFFTSNKLGFSVSLDNFIEKRKSATTLFILGIHFK